MASKPCVANDKFIQRMSMQLKTLARLNAQARGVIRAQAAAHRQAQQ